MLSHCLALVALVYTCHAHLCLISPPQRGSMLGLNKQGAPDCILTKSPCGGRLPPKEHHDGIALAQGENFTVTFQKNLDHFNAKGPGHFSVSLGRPEGQNNTMKELVKMADSGTPALTLYSMNITIPEGEHGPMVLQAQYVTNNTAAPPAFYQCADVIILPKRPPRGHF